MDDHPLTKEQAFEELARAAWHYDMRMWDEVMGDPAALVAELLEHTEALMVLMGGTRGEAESVLFSQLFIPVEGPGVYWLVKE